jgi:predicted nucleotidyltransferase
MVSIERMKNILNTYFSAKCEILSAYVFGSSVTRKTRKDSDIDIALFIDAAHIDLPLRYRIDVVTDLSELLRVRNVDVVILNFANLLLRAQVFEKGLLIYERNPEARAVFQSSSMGLYYDYKRYHQFHSEKLKQKIKDSGLG